MENNQVVLDLETYNRLRDFHTKVTKGEIPSYILLDCKRWTQHFYTKNEAIKTLEADNKALETSIDDLSTEIARLKYPKMFKPTIDDVHKMSIWGFIKWRRK